MSNKSETARMIGEKISCDLLWYDREKAEKEAQTDNFRDPYGKQYRVIKMVEAEDESES